ncbi:probable ATP-dependent RNA helicase DDX10 [Ischnura elegans]|uniref:probable ATP-dependent RNA helicase DDX10 n=1 Tax=Ischnura elegans TaxID=197161 RepID=UPI001ED87D3B|nr:probable ATP-dependent RNA helicase DDX10 [Ischnura elegans]
MDKKNVRKSKKKFQVFKTKPSTSLVEREEIKKLTAQYDQVDTETTGRFFRDFPLSQKTLKGLKENGYLKPTEIQKESLMLSLRGMDILGAAKTGSGKTLAFLIPILEKLYCSQWTRLDGVGALIITPTRELAYQIFETLKKVGQFHDFSAGLIIGGKDWLFERKRMDQVNIVICTPGRLLQHMDENYLFNCSNLQILVLDEADRCLDLGFEETMNNIIQNLPTERQTLLFSATQTRSVKDLARLSLKDPMYVSVHEHAKHSTPEGLRQSYLVVELEDKVSMLWSFLKNHKKHKILVFMASCKQVKFMFEAFCRLRPGVSLLALYGSLHQLRRMAIYESFCRKNHAVLFATDIAARGLDFPAVHWVIQLDCPEDAATYIHRAGRTARYEKGGESLLVLLPSEKEAMVKRLEAAKVPIGEIKISANKLQSPQRKLEAFLARDVELKATAQRAFVAYIKSVFLMKDKEVFKVNSLKTDAFSRSLGLAIPPRIRFLQRMEKKKAATGNIKEDNSDEDSETDAFNQRPIKVETDVKVENDDEYAVESTGFEKQSSSFQEPFKFGSVESDSEDDILVVKRRNHELENDEEGTEIKTEEDLSQKQKKKVLTKAAIAKRVLKKKIIANKKTVFDEEGNAIVNYARDKVSEAAREYENEDVPEGGINIEKAKLVLKEEDQFDRKLFRERVRAKHREQKKKLKEAKMNEKKKKEEKTDDTEEDEFSSSESEGPDLSWLPDPDKVFGKQNEDEESASEVENESAGESEGENSSSPEEDQSSLPHSKRKLSTNLASSQRKRHKKDFASEIATKGALSLQEEEELAMQLLRQ